MGQNAFGQPLLRKEDARLLTGQGRFIDDIVMPGMLHAVVLRSPHAHARLVSVDAAPALSLPGVAAVLTGRDWQADGHGGLYCDFDPPKLFEGTPTRTTPLVRPPFPPLALDTVRYVGDGVAFVLADSPETARQAAELVEVEYAALPSVTGLADAARDGAPEIWPEAPGNVAYRWEVGDAGAVDAAFAAAAHVTRVDLVNNRVVATALETRGAIGEYAADSQRYTLTTPTQLPHALRRHLAQHAFGIEQDRIRVVVPDVGGSFGAKNSLYPEQILVLWAARRLGRAVKWIGDRAESFLADAHARDNVTTVELALDSDHRFLGLRVLSLANLGAYLANKGSLSPVTNIGAVAGVYLTPAIHVQVRGMFTNTAPTDVYRGAGRPEAVYVIERVVDAAARELGLSPVDLRRRNLIPPEALPYRTPLGLRYDSGNFGATLDEALRQIDYDAFLERRRVAAQQGKLRGLGLCTYVERCGAGVTESVEMGFDAEGRVTVLSGAQSNGQGHETALAQIVSGLLGLSVDEVEVVQGDTDRVAQGNGTGGSRSIPLGGAALSLAAEEILAKARRIAGHLLEAAESDLEFQDGEFVIAGTDRRIALGAVARAAHDPSRLPPGEEPGLDGRGRFVPPNHTFPNGTHVCEVEVDAETGALRVLDYTMVHDFGTVVNPLLLAGQMHGGVAQGLGQAVWEHAVYDPESGQMLAGSLMDYTLPRADDMPGFTLVSLPTDCPANPLGIKGCGEAGSAGGPPALVNAVVDALAPYGVVHVDMPTTAERLWRTMREASAGGARPGLTSGL